MITVVVFIALQYEVKVNAKEVQRRHEDPEEEEMREVAVAPNFTLFSCVWISVFFAANNTLFLKSGVLLLSSSFESTDNLETNLTDPVSYIICMLVPVCMLSMEYFRQKALSLFGAIYVVPLFEVLCITLTSVIGMVYFEVCILTVLCIVH